jgi:2-polyprenyl-6-methoxyphenol hydroxylase-like FAD-dependent oxidoreductase
MSRIIVVGASVAGLSVALLLARDGHEVLVLDGDDVSPGAPDEVIGRAFRPGAPHAVQTHAFLARGRMVLRDRLPDVLAQLYAQGVVDLPLPLPPSLTGQEVDLDDDLVFLMCRRPLVEWALRATAALQTGLQVRSSEKVTGLCLDDAGGVPRVTGVTTGTGRVVSADIIIDASGRRSSTVRWLRNTLDVGPAMRSEECGLVYFSRAYKIRDGVTSLPALNRGFAAGAVLPRFATLLAPCENGHVLVAITSLAGDLEMKGVRVPDAFDQVLRTVGVVSPWMDVLEPTTGVYAMGGLQSTLVRLVRDGEVVVRGVHTIGDACSTTSPTYGRGLSWALAHAAVLADAIAAHPDGLEQQAQAVDAWISGELVPFYDEAVAADRARVQAMRAAKVGIPIGDVEVQPGDDVRIPPRPRMAEIIAASTVDSYVWSRVTRYQSLLITPGELYDDDTLRDRIARAGMISLPAPAGPTNARLSAILA